MTASSRRSRFLPGPSPIRQLADCLRGTIDEHTDWVTCLEAANQNYVAPALCMAIRNAEPSGVVDPEAMQYLEDILTLNGERNRRLSKQLSELTEAMNRDGITPIVIKGAAILAAAAKPELTTRMLVDLDILVMPDETAAAEAALRAIGYEKFEDSEDEHSVGSFFRASDVGAVDLHFQLADRMAEVISQADLEARTELVSLGPGRARVPDRSLQFVMNIAHEMLHDETLSKGRVSFRYLLDLAGLASDPGNPLDRDWIEGKCEHWKFELALELQARMVRELLDITLEPGGKRTALGALLHRRRLLKAHNPALDQLEWDLVWRFKNLLRKTRLDPTPLIARTRNRRLRPDSTCRH